MAAKYPLVLNSNAIQELQVGDSLATPAITSGGTSINGTITGQWTLTSGSTFTSTYADLAEWYTSDYYYDPGTVVVFGGEQELTTTTTFGDTRVAGIVTTNPAYIMNGNLQNMGTSVCIALQGRVKCKVVGRVNKGDLLTTSATPGYAVKSLNPTVGTIVGKALENKDNPDGGFIDVAVGRC